LCLQGHRKWLEDGTIERGEPPHAPSSLDVIKQLKGVTFKNGKGIEHQRPGDGMQWE